MRDDQYNILVFGFTEKNELWEHIVYIVDLNIKAETELATGLDVSGEQRIHACGRAQAWQDIKTLLLTERKKGLEAKGVLDKEIL
jgi:hypothetical protein